MICKRCGNTKAQYFYRINSDVYCRQCIQFGRRIVNQEDKQIRPKYSPTNVDYTLQFELSQRQKEISSALVTHYKEHKNSLVIAVCGSGKTEIVFQVIQYALARGERVCFALPRRALVEELGVRLSQAFNGTKLGVFYGGNCGDLSAQLIICTMHQLYRFEDCGFDLIIADEVDAFPFYQNSVLNEMFHRVCSGSYIKMSATFEKSDMLDEEILIMNRRYHNHDLPVPQVKLIPKVIQKWVTLLLIKKKESVWIVFVPTIKEALEVSTWLKRYEKECYCIHSQVEHIETILGHVKSKGRGILVSTSVLERGITIKGVQVIVMGADHQLYKKSTLIQIAGRVGRHIDSYDGQVWFLCQNKSRSIIECQKTIRMYNTMNV